MIKISIEELDALVVHKEATDGNVHPDAPMETKEPALRKPIDAAVSAATAVGGGLAAGAVGLSKLKTNMPLNKI